MLPRYLYSSAVCDTWYRLDDVLRILPGTNRAMVRLSDGAVVQGTIDNLISAGRLTYARRKDGTWVPFASNAPRITDAGMTIEPSATNYVTNNAMQGAVVGAPGTLPPGWSLSGTIVGLTREIVGVGVEDGIDYIDVRYVGTATTTLSGGSLGYITSTLLAVAETGQAWTASGFCRILSASGVTNLTLAVTENNSSGNGIAKTASGTIPSSGSLSSNRVSATRVFNTAGVAYASVRLELSCNNAAAVDFTVRIGWPQLELGSIATTPIRTTGAAATRATDVFNCPTSGISLPASGTLIGEIVSAVPLNPGPVSTFGTIISLSDTTNSRVVLRTNNSNGNGPMGIVGDGTALSTLIPIVGAAADVVTRAAMRYRGDAANAALSKDGAAAVTVARVASFGAPSDITIGRGFSIMRGVIREVCLRSTPLPDTDLQVESARYVA